MLYPSGVRTAPLRGKQRFLDDVCIEHTVLDNYVSASWQTLNLSSSWSCKQGCNLSAYSRCEHILFTTVFSSSYSIKHAGLGKSEVNHKKINKYFRVRLSCARFLSPRQCLWAERCSQSSTQSNEQRLPFRLCGELQSVPAAFVCMYCMGNKNSSQVTRDLWVST